MPSRHHSLQLLIFSPTELKKAIQDHSNHRKSSEEQKESGIDKKRRRRRRTLNDAQRRRISVLNIGDKLVGLLSHAKQERSQNYLIPLTLREILTKFLVNCSFFLLTGHPESMQDKLGSHTRTLNSYQNHPSRAQRRSGGPKGLP